MSAAAYQFKSVELGGFTYVLRQAPASASLRAAAVLANSVAPLVNGMRRGKGSTDGLLLGVAETFADPALGANLETLCCIFKEFTQVSYPDGRSFALAGEHGVYDSHFAGRIDMLLKWLQESVEWNLGGFLAELKSRLPKAKLGADAGATQTESASTSPKDAATSG